jgi:hypothetical protein
MDEMCRTLFRTRSPSDEGINEVPIRVIAIPEPLVV